MCACVVYTPIPDELDPPCLVEDGVLFWENDRDVPGPLVFPPCVEAWMATYFPETTFEPFRPFTDFLQQGLTVFLEKVPPMATFLGTRIAQNTLFENQITRGNIVLTWPRSFHDYEFSVYSTNGALCIYVSDTLRYITFRGHILELQDDYHGIEYKNDTVTFSPNPINRMINAVIPHAYSKGKAYLDHLKSQNVFVLSHKWIIRPLINVILNRPMDTAVPLIGDVISDFVLRVEPVAVFSNPEMYAKRLPAVPEYHTPNLCATTI